MEKDRQIRRKTKETARERTRRETDLDVLKWTEREREMVLDRKSEIERQRERDGERRESDKEATSREH
jgi:hypothetical protein